MASSMITKTLFSLCSTLGPAVELLVCSLEDRFSNALCAELHLCVGDSIFVANWAKLGHYTFKPKCVALLSVLEGTPQYGIVRHIVLVVGKTYVIVKKLITCHYDEHFHAYSVTQESYPIVSCVLLEECKDNVPLNFHHLNYEGSSVSVTC